MPVSANGTDKVVTGAIDANLPLAQTRCFEFHQCAVDRGAGRCLSPVAGVVDTTPVLSLPPAFT